MPAMPRGALPTIANLVECGHDLSTWCRACESFGETLRYEWLLERFGPDMLVVHVDLYLRCKRCGSREAETRISVRDNDRFGR
jgi:hypothetical protein